MKLAAFTCKNALYHIDDSDSGLRRKIARDNSKLKIINKTIYKIFEVRKDTYSFKYYLLVDFNGESTCFSEWNPPPEISYIGTNGDILFNDRVYTPNQLLKKGY